MYPRRQIKHPGASPHLEGEACPHCHDVIRVVERTPAGGQVQLVATAVHAHECPYWRMGVRHAACTCGANEAWGRHRQAMVDKVFGR